MSYDINSMSKSKAFRESNPLKILKTYAVMRGQGRIDRQPAAGPIRRKSLSNLGLLQPRFRGGRGGKFVQELIRRFRSAPFTESMPERIQPSSQRAPPSGGFLKNKKKNRKEILRYNFAMISTASGIYLSEWIYHSASCHEHIRSSRARRFIRFAVTFSLSLGRASCIDSDFAISREAPLSVERSIEL